MAFFWTGRFLPLFITQFFGAMNDNLLKNALVMLVTYRIALASGGNAQILVTLAAGLFILPFFLFSATAGQLADKYDRAALTRIIKIAEICIMAVASVGFVLRSEGLLLAALFGMGVHSTFFGPIKYALLPQHLADDELLAGNAYIEAGTFLAILLGTILGGLLVLQAHGILLICAGLLAVAVAGYVASRRIPAAAGSEPGLRISPNFWAETGRILAYARGDKQIFLCILGISWFWLVGGTLVAEFAPFVRDVLHAGPAVVTLLLTVFSVGIGGGSFLCNRLARGHIQSTYVPLAALAITVFGVDLYFASRHFGGPGGMLTVAQFLPRPRAWRVLADLFLMAVAGGVYIVPLYAIMQHRSAPQHRARVIAANNVVNAIFMVAAAILTIVLLSLHFTIPDVFLLVALANLLVAVYICRLLPDDLLRSLARAVLGLCFRVEVRGMEHYTQARDRVLIIANHTSFLDAALIAAFLPEKITFAVNTYIARVWWMQPFLALVDALPLDPANPLATKVLIDLLKKGARCMVFPEGRITGTGALMKIYEGPGMIADKSGAILLPIRIEGAQYTIFSRLRGKVRIRWFPKITLTILPPHEFNIADEITGRKRRQVASGQLYDVMSEMMFDSSDYRRTLFDVLITARKIHGRRQVIAEDIERKPMNYGQFLLRCFALGGVLRRMFPGEQFLGVLLPNSSVTAVTFFALQAYGKTPAMINFSAGGAQMVLACEMALVRTVLTSRRFVKMGKLDEVVAALREAGIDVAFLEDIGAAVRASDKVSGFLASLFPATAYRRTGRLAAADDPAVVLYTSGSEGTPKGVALSHANILANCSQLASRIDFGPQDKVLNVLPMFHAFGLTGGTLLPILNGIKTFYYPSPLHYRIVPELIYDTNSTVMFGTDTFLSAYARFANPYDMNSIRYIFAGAEKLKEETRRVYADKFGVRVLEGYGATETSPVMSINTPMQNRTGSVGRLLPGIAWRLDAVEGIEEGGQLCVKGPNVMLGYFKADAPGQIQPPPEGWYDTGDIVSMDEQGYIFIKGRTKRFAKIGGEMVSLAAVEAAVARLWPEHAHAVVNVPDAKKGEQIVLLTSYEGAARDEVARFLRAEKMTELAAPKRVVVVKAVPVLGTGKTDYQKAKAIAAADQAVAAA